MLYRLLADLVVTIHFLFILFVVLGGLLVLKWKKLAWLHIPCVIWGVLIEFRSWVCPLTYVENYFRRLAGSSGYEGSFIDHYLIPLIYPHGLTPSIQFVLGSTVILTNLVIYGLIILKHQQRPG